jgi:hypothetical protein
MWQNPLAIISVTVLAMVIFGGVITGGFFFYQKAKRIVTLVHMLEQDLAILSSAVRNGALDFQAIPRLVEGLTAVTKEEVDQLAEIQKVVATLSDAMFGTNAGGYIKEAENNTERANRAYEIQQLRRNGIPQSEAEARVDERDLWKRMTPGVVLPSMEE